MGFETIDWKSTTWLVETVARQLKSMPEFAGEDERDIRQDLYLKVLSAWDRYDASRAGPSTYASAVVKNAAATMVIRQRARLRCLGTPAPLDDQPAADTADLAWALREDLGPVLAALPPRDYEVVRLVRDLGPEEATRHLGIPRGTLYARTVKIRGALRAAGLEEYLE